MHRRHFTIAADHPALAGHFPGHPIAPGALLLAEVIEAALATPALAARLGQLPGIASVKFMRTVVPPARLSVDFDAAPTRIRFEVREGERTVLSGQFEPRQQALGGASAMP